ncbi:MAG TPA: hypothetical protein VFB38_10655 [Chthonomonadaceae bacterium]|nr:hypothetical protein [Chthonomonadaceae bacterium]
MPKQITSSCGICRRGKPSLTLPETLKAERQHIRKRIANLGVDVVTIYVDTPKAIARQRLLENRLTKTRVDYPDSAFNEIVSAMEPPDAEENPIIFHYEDDLETWITEHLASALR